MRRIKRLLGVAFLMLATCRRAAAGDTTSVYFPFNQAILPAEMLRILDTALVTGALSGNGRFLIIGHTDALGTEGYNLQLSRRRAEAVRDVLLSSGVQPAEITLLTGLGEQQAGEALNPDSRPVDRRVDVVLLRKGWIPPQPRLTAADARDSLPETQPAPGPRRDDAKHLSELATGESFILRNVYFYAGRHRVRPESYPALQELLQALISKPGLRIRIEGHVCCIAPQEPDALDEDTRRQELSINRARAIRSMLIEQGVDAGRLEAAGYGYRYPIVRNERTEEEANRNRRVEVRILAE